MASENRAASILVDRTLSECDPAICDCPHGHRRLGGLVEIEDVAGRPGWCSCWDRPVSCGRPVISDESAWFIWVWPNSWRERSFWRPGRSPGIATAFRSAGSPSRPRQSQSRSGRTGVVVRRDLASRSFTPDPAWTRPWRSRSAFSLWRSRVAHLGRDAYPLSPRRSSRML